MIFTYLQEIHGFLTVQRLRPIHDIMSVLNCFLDVYHECMNIWLMLLFFLLLLALLCVSTTFSIISCELTLFLQESQLLPSRIKFIQMRRFCFLKKTDLFLLSGLHGSKISFPLLKLSLSFLHFLDNFQVFVFKLTENA